LGFLFYEFLRRSAKPPWKLPPFPFQNTSFSQSVSPSARPVSSLRPSFLAAAAAAAAVASDAWSFHVSLHGSRLLVQLDATIQKHCKTKIATILSLSPLSLQVVPFVVTLLLVLELLLLSLSLSLSLAVCVCICVSFSVFVSRLRQSSALPNRYKQISHSIS
jgi:hypothetical protein